MSNTGIQTIEQVWSQHINGPFPPETTIVFWLRKYSVEQLTQAIEITSDWLRRTGSHPLMDCVKYVSAVARNIYNLQDCGDAPCEPAEGGTR